MNCSRTITANVLSKQSAAHILKSLNGKITLASVRPGFLGLHQQHDSSRRTFSTTRPTFIREFMPAPETHHIKQTEASWEHPIYTYEQMEAVKIAHRDVRTWSDRVALTVLRTMRWGMDFCTGYRHDKAVALAKKDPKAALQRSTMNERKWLMR